MGLLSDILVQSAGTAGFCGGIARGIVKENRSGDNPGKVKVELFLGEESANVTGWISVMSPYAGDKFGYYSLPEIGSEVVVGFTMGDRNCPVVLGCLWNSKNTLPENTADNDNIIKRLKTKGGCEIVFDDTDGKQKLEIKTPSSAKILLDDEDGKIAFSGKDEKNSVVIDVSSGEITIEAEKKIIFKAGGSEAAVFDGGAKSIKLDSGKLELNAQSDLAVKGQNIKISGTGVDIAANGSIGVKANGITEVKGSMVKIN